MRLLRSTPSRALKGLAFVLSVALIASSGSAVYGIACNRDCKKLSEVCSKPGYQPNVYTIQYLAPQGGYWFDTIAGNGNRCSLGWQISYNYFLGCTPKCTGNIHNSRSSTAGTMFLGTFSHAAYGCRIPTGDCL